MKRIRIADSFRCSKIIAAMLLALMPAFASTAWAQSSAWNLPRQSDRVTAVSAGLGSCGARETYLSLNSYHGISYNLAWDSWKDYNSSSRSLAYGRSRSKLLVSPMHNQVGGGSTWMAMATFLYSGCWRAYADRQVSVLAGPSAQFVLGGLYNRMNSNNPATAESSLTLGAFTDITCNINPFGYEMAVQFVANLSVLGLGFAPDYDQPYYYMYKYNQWGSALHFLNLINSTEGNLELALIMPVGEQRLRLAAHVGLMSNSMGGHSRDITVTSLSLGYMFNSRKVQWNP